LLKQERRVIMTTTAAEVHTSEAPVASYQAEINEARNNATADLLSLIIKGLVAGVVGLSHLDTAFATLIEQKGKIDRKVAVARLRKEVNTSTKHGASIVLIARLLLIEGLAPAAGETWQVLKQAADKMSSIALQEGAIKAVEEAIAKHRAKREGYTMSLRTASLTIEGILPKKEKAPVEEGVLAERGFNALFNKATQLAGVQHTEAIEAKMTEIEAIFAKIRATKESK
jgi:hypothetical protein